MALSKKGLIVNTIIAIVIAAIFVLMASSILFNILGNIPRVSGAIVNPTKVICFGGGSDHTVHCLDKSTGNQVFQSGSATNWQDENAVTTPALTKDAIYVGIGGRVCASKIDGMAKWDCKLLQTSGSNPRIAGSIAIGRDGLLACMSVRNYYTDSGKTKTFPIYCLVTESGNVFATVNTNNLHSTAPTFNRNDLYFGAGTGSICNYKVENDGLVLSGCNVIANDEIPTNIAVNESGDLACFGGGGDHRMHCVKTSDRSEEFAVHCNAWKGEGSDGCKAMSTPTLVNGSAYFGIGGRVCKYPLTTKGTQSSLPSNSDTNWCTSKYSHTIETGIAVNESMQLACFGGGEAHTVYCVNTTTGAELFKIRSGAWGSAKAATTPLIENSTLYIALGDHVCAFKLPITGDKYKDFEKRYNKQYDADADQDILWPECAEFEHDIATDFATYTGEFDENEASSV